MTIEEFTKLYSINVNDKVEKKNKLTYLSWSYAWAEFKKVYPDATYEIKLFDNKPYIYDENLGYMVFTSVSVGDLTHEMRLPVMDGYNRAMKSHEYTYKVKDRDTKQIIERTVDPATMFDVNKTIMRCLTKNLAMFGLGLYIYAWEDLPEEEKKESKKEKDSKENKPIFWVAEFETLKAKKSEYINAIQVLDIVNTHYQLSSEWEKKIEALFK